MIAPWLFIIAGHACVVPSHAVVRSAGDHPLTRRETLQLERFASCICGPEGTTSYDPQPIDPSVYPNAPRRFYGSWPSCNRDGWDGHRYRSQP